MTPARVTGPLLLAAMGVVMGAGLAARGGEGAAPDRRVAEAGLSWRVPAGWHAAGAATGVAEPVQALVLTGRRAGARRLREAERMLDSLEVQPIPPPERPVWDAWRLLITESGDSMRVPPGWRAWVLAVPRRHARPRLLFRAGTVGVVLRVVERRPGPVSRRYPSLKTDPFPHRQAFIFERGGRRAGGGWRGYRFEVTITAARGAADEDVDRAFAAASSLALSGGHRECGPACTGAR